MKKKVIVIIGSLNENSRTNLFLEKILARLNTLDRSYYYEILKFKNYKINYCKGCQECFKSGKCINDFNDDMHKIGYKLKTSNIIVFASPVYANNISGITKSIIDRLIYEAHTLSLAGKLGFVLSTTHSSGVENVNDYLKTTMQHLGIKCLNTYSISYDKIRNFDNNVIDNFIYDISYDMYINLKNNVSYSNLFLEKLFKFYKVLYSNKKQIDYTEYEERYWNQEWILKTYSFQEYAKKINEMRRD